MISRIIGFWFVMNDKSQKKGLHWFLFFTHIYFYVRSSGFTNIGYLIDLSCKHFQNLVIIATQKHNE